MNKNELSPCPGCGAEPGTPHVDGCDVERCSVCGRQRIACNCPSHDPLFSRWTGLWPGEAEANYLGIDLNEFYASGAYRHFFIKPEDKNHE